jgi:hypothetical protein
MNQVAARLATRRRKPYVLTHYGTEIWHHDGKDAAFRRLNARASHVTFYSQALLERGRELGVPCRAMSVVYPPVADVFRPLPAAARLEIRRRFAPARGPLLLNVKRLHRSPTRHAARRHGPCVRGAVARVLLVMNGRPSAARLRPRSPGPRGERALGPRRPTRRWRPAGAGPTCSCSRRS